MAKPITAGLPTSPQSLKEVAEAYLKALGYTPRQVREWSLDMARALARDLPKSRAVDAVRRKCRPVSRWEIQLRALISSMICRAFASRISSLLGWRSTAGVQIPRSTHCLTSVRDPMSGFSLPLAPHCSVVG